MEDIGALKQILVASTEAHLTPLLWGKHGIGKSAIIRSIYEEMGYEVIDLRLGQMEVGDLIGIPAQEFSCPMCDTKFGFSVRDSHCPVCQADGKNVPLVGQTVWLPPSWFPQKGEKRLIFFDELNRGRLDVQQCTFQIVLDRRIHTHKIPDNCAIICACNPSGGDYYVEELDPALLNRFINLKWTLTTRQWLRWAREHNILPEVIEFIQTDEKSLGNDPVDVPIDLKPTPRGYEFLSKILSRLPKSQPLWSEVASAILGETAALAFMLSLKDDVEKPVKAEDIFKSWAKVKSKIKKQAQAEEGDTRHDLLRVTLDEIYDYIKDGKGKDLADDEIMNLSPFLLMLPRDLAFSALKDLAPINEVHERVLMKPEGKKLFELLKEARK